MDLKLYFWSHIHICLQFIWGINFSQILRFFGVTQSHFFIVYVICRLGKKLKYFYWKNDKIYTFEIVQTDLKIRHIHCQIVRVSEPLTVRLSKCQSLWLSNCQSVGASDYQTVRVLEPLTVKLSECLLHFSFLTVLTLRTTIGTITFTLSSSPHYAQAMTLCWYLSWLVTSTPTSSIWLVTRTDSLLVLLLVVSVAFQVPVLVVSAWHLVVFNLYQ
jgi:hypothetical protein